ncbi:MAG: hypothetical protein AAGC58_10575 [Asticcacaulis sp.]
MLLRNIFLITVLVALSGCASVPPAGGAEENSSSAFQSLFGEPLSPDEMAKRIQKAEAGYPLGSKENPVRVSMPQGQRAYLAQLRCEDGQVPAFHRGGSVGLGPYDNIIDRYEVTCAGSKPEKTMIFMDMYFAGHVETRPVEGFTRVPPSINWPNTLPRPEVTLPPAPK